MSDYAVRKIVCRQCYALLDIMDNYCRHCGAATAYSRGSSGEGRDAQPLGTQQVGGHAATHGIAWSESPWVVLPAVLLVLGPFGLPMLWRCRRLTPLAKTVLTAIVGAVTAAVLVLIWHTYQVALAPLRALRDCKAF